MLVHMRLVCSVKVVAHLPNSGAEVRPAAVELLDLCLSIHGLVLLYTIIDPVQRLYKALVQLLVQHFHLLLVLGVLARLCYRSLHKTSPKVLVDESGRRELCAVLRREDLVEPALVVVVPMAGRVVHAPDVEHNVARLELGRVARTDEVCFIKSANVPMEGSMAPPTRVLVLVKLPH